MPSSPPDFSAKAYWSERFQTEQRFEWLLPSSQTLSLVLETSRLIHPYHPSSTTLGTPFRVLHFGCGTSSLGRDIREGLLSVYPSEELQVVDADYATSSLPPRTPTDVSLIDIDFLSPLQADIEQYDLLIDKSTADAISCGPNLPHPKTDLTVEPVQILCYNLARMTRNGGRWICVSYSASRFDWDVGEEGWKVVEKRGMKGWSGNLTKEEVEEVKKEVEVELGGSMSTTGRRRKGRKKVQEERVVYEPEVGVWVYILERI